MQGIRSRKSNLQNLQNSGSRKICEYHLLSRKAMCKFCTYHFPKYDYRMNTHLLRVVIACAVI